MSTSGDGGGWDVGAGGLPGAEDDLGERRSRKRTKQGVYISGAPLKSAAEGGSGDCGPEGCVPGAGGKGGGVPVPLCLTVISPRRARAC